MTKCRDSSSEYLSVHSLRLETIVIATETGCDCSFADERTVNGQSTKGTQKDPCLIYHLLEEKGREREEEVGCQKASMPAASLVASGPNAPLQPKKGQKPGRNTSQPDPGDHSEL